MNSDISISPSCLLPISRMEMSIATYIIIVRIKIIAKLNASRAIIPEEAEIITGE